MNGIHDDHEERPMRAELRALDPDHDPLASGRFEGAVASGIARAVCSPRVPIDPLFGLWSLPRPILLAASIVAIAVAGLSARAHARTFAPPATIAESMGVPSRLLASGVTRR